MIMRKNYQMWLLGALFGGLVLPFAGCSNEDDPTPNESGNGETFETELAVMFSRGANTKASDNEAGYEDGKTTPLFTGMTNMKLLGYRNEDIGTSNYVTEDMILIDEIDLSPDLPAGDKTDVKARYNISLKSEKQSFMFYGESLYEGVGKLTATYPENDGGQADATKFALTPLEAITTNLSTLQTYIQNVANAAIACVKTDDDNKSLNQLKQFFTSCKSASVYQVAYMMDELYFNTEWFKTDKSSLTSAITGTGADAVFTFDGGSFTGNSKGDLFAKVNEDKDNQLGELFPKGGKTLDITFSTENAATVTISDNVNTFNRPTSLYYMANSYLVSYTNYDGLDWASDAQAGGENSGVVDQAVDLSSSSPTKVALYDQIQFAVGQLLVNFMIEGNVSGNEDSPANIDPSDILLKGILIGHQNEVGWNFLPTDYNTDATKAAYDNTGAKNKKELDPDGTSNPPIFGTNEYAKMRMLALPTEPGQTIAIALELKNDSEKAFEGVNNGIVPPGATFYVTAKLSLDGKSVEGVDPEDLAVFMSDYVTTANLTLKSLENAENTVPNLDETQLEFALGVDLDWKPGIVFNVDIL